jgi:hypothetical protein
MWMLLTRGVQAFGLHHGDGLASICASAASATELAVVDGDVGLAAGESCASRAPGTSRSTRAAAWLHALRTGWPAWRRLADIFLIANYDLVRALGPGPI